MPASARSEAALLEEIQQLRARVASLETERQVPKEIVEKAPVMISIMRAPDFIYELANPAFQALAPGKQFVGRRFADVWAEVADPLIEILQNVIATGQTFHVEDAPYTIQRGPGMPPEVVYVTYSWIPLLGPDGKPDRVLTLAHEVTGAVRERQQLTESKEALRESEEQFRVLTENLQSAVALIDERGAFSIVNSSFRRIFDIPQDADILNINSRDWSQWQVFSEDGLLLDVDDHPVRRAALSCTPVKNQLVAVQSPSTPNLKWLLISAEPILDSHGKIHRLICTYYDITDRKRAEEALRESEEQFRTLANAIPQLCWMANADGWIFWYNQRWYEYTGTTPEQMEGWGWQSVHDPEELPKVLDRWKRSIGTGEPFDMVFPLRGADGVFRPFLTRVMPVFDRDGKVARWFGTNTDISEHRKTEEALASSENRLRALLESASQGVVAVDERGRMMLVNAKTEEIFGYTRNELLGQPLNILLPDRYRDAHAEHVRHYFANPRTRPMGLGLALFGRTKDGGQFPLEISLSSIEEGGSRLAMALITDITERKKAEERLWQAQKLESIGLLAGGVAHDFNNLLVGVMGNASLAREMLDPVHDAVELLDGVIKTGEQLAHLTRQMLAYSGKGRFLVEPLDLSDILPEMSGLVQPSIPKKIAVHLELEPNLPLVEADRGQLQQIFMNLVINAAEAIGSGAGEISVKAGTEQVDEAYIRQHAQAADLHPGKYVTLEVRDTGCGMEEATKARIFDPFYSTKFTGRGLGLAAVAGIVRSHKGAIRVDSTPGEGSCFTVFFPAAPEHVAVSTPRNRRMALQGTGTILVVDDEKTVRELAKKTLERYGYKVLLASDGMAAIDAFKRYPGDISLVIMDLSMPEMGGDEALPELRKLRPDVKIMVSSGYNESETMAFFRGQLVSGFVQKPYTTSVLVENVKAVLS